MFFPQLWNGACSRTYCWPNAPRVAIRTHPSFFRQSHRVKETKPHSCQNSIRPFSAATILLFLGVFLYATLEAYLVIAAESLPQEPVLFEQSEEFMEELQFLKEETVSIAVRHEQPISKAPANVYVITDEDIRHSGASDLPTVLRRIPGLEVMQMTGAEFNVSVRGDNQLLANKLLILVDGRSIYIDAQGFLFWKSIPVTLPEIKRIEFLKGPAAAVYGFNAFDGVVNIITKSPEEIGGSILQIGGGEFGTINTAAIYGKRQGKFGYRVSAGYDHANQWEDQDAVAFRAYRFNIQTDYALTTASKVMVSGGVVDTNRFDGPVQRNINLSSSSTLPYVYVGYEQPESFLRFWWNQFDAKSKILTNPVLVGLLRTTDSEGSPNLNFLGNTFNISAQHAMNLLPENRLTFGINYRLNTFSGNSVTGANDENRLGIYLQDEWQATDRLTLVAGVRYDLDTFIHQQFSPRGAILYTPVSGHTFRLGISVANRPPTLFETHEDLLTVVFPFPPSRPPISIEGSGNLKPEKIVSYQLGYQGWFLKHRLRARAELFFNHISNLIDLEQVSPTLLKNSNSGGVADIYGGEGGFEFLATHWLTGFANVAYQDIRQSLTGTFRRGGPKWKINAGVRGEWDNGLSGEVAFHYVGAATYPVSDFFSAFATAGLIPSSSVPNPRVDSYNLLNLRVGYWFWHDTAELAFSAFNALNDQHKEHPLGETIKSRVMGWLTIKF